MKRTQNVSHPERQISFGLDKVTAMVGDLMAISEELEDSHRRRRECPADPTWWPTSYLPRPTASTDGPRSRATTRGVPTARAT
jgi:hypothetical protein